jgi:hypothetical protein
VFVVHSRIDSHIDVLSEIIKHKSNSPFFDLAKKTKKTMLQFEGFEIEQPG